MSAQMKHSPLPWRMTDDKQRVAVWSEDSEYAICPINIAAEHARSPTVARANAAFIVRAVNSHAELLAALQDLVTAYPTHRSMTNGEHLLLDAARAAITKATQN